MRGVGHIGLVVLGVGGHVGFSLALTAGMHVGDQKNSQAFRWILYSHLVLHLFCVLCYRLWVVICHLSRPGWHLPQLHLSPAEQLTN